MLSPEVQQRLEAARLALPEYQPNESIRQKLAEKVLVMLVGPAAIGKTHIIEKMHDIDPAFHPVSIFSTRDPRPDDDPTMFRLYPHNDESVSHILDLKEKGEVVQVAVHPSGRIYGTTIEDYQGEINTLPVLSSGVELFRNLPFKETFTIGLVDNTATWSGRFNQRYRPSHPDRQKRLGEAVVSLQWLQNDDQTVLIENIDGNASATAQGIINLVRHGEKPDTADAYYRLRDMEIWARNAA